MDYTVQGILHARILEWVAFPSPGDIPNPGIEPRSPSLQADSFPAEPQGKSKNTGVGTLSLLQGIFLTQDSNRGLLHCTQIPYQLSYQGIPHTMKPMIASCLGSPQIAQFQYTLTVWSGSRHSVLFVSLFKTKRNSRFLLKNEIVS